MISDFSRSVVCTHLAEPLQARLTASRYPPTTEAWAAPASPALFRTHQTVNAYCQAYKHCSVRPVTSADLVVAEQTPDKHRCSHCSSSVYGAHTLSLSGSLAPHRLSLVASGVVVDTGHSSGAVWTVGG